MNEELKYCKFCNKKKPKKDFCKSGGFTKNICRECHNKKQKERYANSKLVEAKDKEIERLNNIIKDIKAQLDYLETYSSLKDVYEDMSRRLNNIEKIIGDSSNGEKTTMFKLLNERMEKEDIVKLVCNYDNKFNELEENNKQLKSQLQQKENIVKEVREYFKNHTLKYDDLMLIKPSDVLEILDKENK